MKNSDTMEIQAIKKATYYTYVYMDFLIYKKL